METNTLQLHEKVQKLIEQYTLDKKKMEELEFTINDKTKEINALREQIIKLQNELQGNSSKQSTELSDLRKKNQELEKLINSFENFAMDLNTQLDGIIPKIEKI